MVMRMLWILRLVMCYERSGCLLVFRMGRMVFTRLIMSLGAQVPDLGFHISMKRQRTKRVQIDFYSHLCILL